MQKNPRGPRKAAKKKKLLGRKRPPADSVEKSAGTQRWPKGCLGKGEWLQVPKSVIQRLDDFDMKPHHLWLLLALQTDRFRDRPPRYYWEALAGWAGVSCRATAQDRAKATPSVTGSHS